jgi:hypothetical protein
MRGALAHFKWGAFNQTQPPVQAKTSSQRDNRGELQIKRNKKRDWKPLEHLDPNLVAKRQDLQGLAGQLY